MLNKIVIFSLPASILSDDDFCNSISHKLVENDEYVYELILRQPPNVSGRDAEQ